MEHLYKKNNWISVNKYSKLCGVLTHCVLMLLHPTPNSTVTLKTYKPHNYGSCENQ